MKTPKHLWSGDWRTEAKRLREERAAAATDRAAAADRPEEDGQPAESPAVHEPVADSEQPDVRRRSYRGVLWGVGVVLVALAVAAAFLIGSELNGDDSNDQAAQGPARASGQAQAAATYAKASPAVASIRTGSGAGTGFLIDAEGTLVTNAGVVEGASAVTVRFGADGPSVQGEVRGSDPSSDLAVVGIDPSGIPAGTKPLAFADSDRAAVGDAVVAIGNQFGFERTETAGIVSGAQRNIQLPSGFQISEAIQTDAAINSANSGGPLLDDSARVIGVNSQVKTTGIPSGSAGIGLAISSNVAQKVVPVLKEGGAIERPWLGVASLDASSGAGARVVEVVRGSPAAAAGVQAGDIITALDTDSVAGSADLGQLIEDAAVGGQKTLHVERRGRPLELDVSLRLRPTEAP